MMRVLCNRSTGTLTPRHLIPPLIYPEKNIAHQQTDVDPVTAIKKITKDSDKKEDLMLIMTANSKWDQFLLSAPLSISMLGELLLVNVDRAISPKHRCPEGGFKYLKYPDSFQACLVQITNSGLNAFSRAHRNMDEIRLSTANVETHIKYAVRILMGGNAKEVEKILPLALSKVSEIADTCKTLASETEKEFLDVMFLTEEALEASVAVKEPYQEKDEETERNIQRVQEQKEQSEKLKEELEEHYQKKERELNVAKEKFETAVTEMPPTLTLVGAYMVEGMVDTLKSAVSTISAQTIIEMLGKMMLGRQNAEQPQKTADDSPLNLVISIIKSIRNLFDGLQSNINAVEKGALEIKQQLVKEKDRLDGNSSNLHSDLGDCIDEAIEVCSYLNEFTNHATHDDKQDDKIKKSHDKLQNRVQRIEARIKRKHAYPIDSTFFTPERTHSSSLIGCISEVAQFKLEMAKQTYDEARHTHEKTYEELRKERETLMQTLVDLKSMRLTKIDFDDIQKILHKGVRALADVREQWGRLCGFFQMISNLIKCCLHSSLKCFVDYSSEGKDLVIQGARMSSIFRDCIIEQATEANRVAYVVQSISAAYVEISSNYLMDGITSLGTLLSLDTKENLTEMEEKRAQIHKQMKDAEKAISSIMEKK